MNLQVFGVLPLTYQMAYLAGIRIYARNDGVDSLITEMSFICADEDLVVHDSQKELFKQVKDMLKKAYKKVSIKNDVHHAYIPVATLEGDLVKVHGAMMFMNKKGELDYFDYSKNSGEARNNLHIGYASL